MCVFLALSYFWSLSLSRSFPFYLLFSSSFVNCASNNNDSIVDFRAPTCCVQLVGHVMLILPLQSLLLLLLYLSSEDVIFCFRCIVVTTAAAASSICALFLLYCAIAVAIKVNVSVTMPPSTTPRWKRGKLMAVGAAGVWENARIRSNRGDGGSGEKRRFISILATSRTLVTVAATAANSIHLTAVGYWSLLCRARDRTRK